MAPTTIPDVVSIALMPIHSNSGFTLLLYIKRRTYYIIKYIIHEGITRFLAHIQYLIHYINQLQLTNWTKFHNNLKWQPQVRSHDIIMIY